MTQENMKNIHKQKHYRTGSKTMLLFKPRVLTLSIIPIYASMGISTTYALENRASAVESTTLVPIVVTASKRGETLNNFNRAVSIADRTDLDSAQVSSSMELDRVFPELYMSKSASFLFPIITMRGTTSAQDFYNPALTVNVDGVPQLSVFATQSLLGVEQVELLKGPQGTLYGKSAQGGVLNVVTQKPDNIPQFAAQAGLSGRDGYRFQFEGSAPLVPDVLYGSVSLLANDANGDIKSDVLGSDTLGGVKSRAGNVKLRLAPTGSPWDLGLSAVRDCASGDQEVYTTYDDYKSRQAYVLPNLPAAYKSSRQKRCANHFAANLQYDFDNWQLNAIVSNQSADTDRHWPLAAYFPHFSEQWKQNTQEIRLATHGNDPESPSSQNWDGVFGLYHQTVNQAQDYQFDAVLPSLNRITESTSKNRSESLAAYGDMTWHLTPEVDVTTGLRFSKDRAKTDFHGKQAGKEFAGKNAASQNTWLGHVGASYRFSPQWRGYVNIAQGYKPLGYNLAPTSVDDALGYARERSTSYEAGLRYADDKLRANLALYRVDGKDVQLYGDGEVGNQTLRNLGNTRSIGLEFDTEWDVNPQWTLGAGGFINDATFSHFKDSKTCTGCQGNRIPFTPRYGLSLNAKGNINVANTTLQPQLTVRRTGAYYLDSSNSLSQNAYTLVDAGLSWNPTDNLEVMFHAHNLTNTDYRTYGFSFGPAGNFAQVGPGRTLGLTATYRW